MSESRIGRRRRRAPGIAGMWAAALLFAGPSAAGAQLFGGEAGVCGSGGSRAGQVCMDRYEASVWSVPPDNKVLRRKIAKGKVGLADLQEGGALQVTGTDTITICEEEGGDCAGAIFALSLPGVPPSIGFGWHQAQQACASSNGRLPTNAEWQMAAAGTPDPDSDDHQSDCNVAHAPAPILTDLLTAAGSRSDCMSSWGHYDMIGNANEWVADWIVDPMSPGGAGGMLRGGDARGGPAAGVTTIGTTADLCGGADDDQLIGFRCVRP